MGKNMYKQLREERAIYGPKLKGATMFIRLLAFLLTVGLGAQCFNP
jgi:hypothetical protein